MKILRISLRNLASLSGDHTVDFTRGPLLHTGLYSISGLTGSGKSTLLDALCLALYNETPRLSAVAGTEKIADADKGIEQKDPRNLLRRGTAEGYAEVCFVGVDQQVYTARWRVWRARNAVHGALQPVQMTLYSGNVRFPDEGGCLAAGKISEFKTAIEEKIRLSFDQFRRAILLAQGDFAAFLKAKDDERAKILEALTGTEHFAAISKAVFERHKQEQAAVEKIQQQLQGNQPMSVEERGAAELALSDAESELQSLEQKRDSLQAGAQWFADAEKLRLEEAFAQKQYAEALARNQAAEGRRKELQLAEIAGHEARALWIAEKECGQSTEKCRTEDARKREQLEEARAVLNGMSQTLQSADHSYQQAVLERQNAQPLLVQARALDAQLPPLQNAFELALKEWSAVEKAHREMQSALRKENALVNEAQAQRRNLSVELEGIASVAPFAEDLVAWTDRLAEERNRGSAYARCQAEHSKAVSEETTLKVQEADAARSMNEARGVLLEASAALNQAEETVRNIDPVALATERRNRDAIREGLENLRLRIETLRNVESRIHELNGELSSLRSGVVAQEQRFQELENTLIPEAVIAEKTAHRMLEIAKQTVSDHAKAFRLHLVQGEQCPVCGSVEHPFLQGEVIQHDILRELSRDYDLKKQQLGLFQSEAHSLKNSIQSTRVQMKSREEQRARLVSEQERAESCGPECEEALRIWRLEPSQRSAALNDRLEMLAREKADWERREAARIEADKALQKARVNTDKANVWVERESQRHAQSKTALDVCAQRRVLLETALEGARNKWEESLKRVQPLYDAVVFEGLDPSTDSERYQRELERSVGSFHELRKRIALTEEQFSTAERKAGEHRLQLEELARKVVERGVEKSKAQAELDSVRARRNSLFGGGDVQEVERRVEGAVVCAQEQLTGARERQQQAMTRAELARQAQEAAETAAREAGQKHARAAQALRAWILGFEGRAGRTVSVEDVERWLTCDSASMEAERKKLQSIEAEVHTMLGVCTARRDACELHENKRSSSETLEAIQVTLEAVVHSVNAGRKLVDEKKAVVWNDDQRRKQAGEWGAALEERRRKVEPWARLNAFIGSADGKAFREIAQQWTLDVLVKHANAQLGQLAARYYLKRLEGCLNLIVVDRQMSDQIRSVHSLSGGESFLVSLGLALGLASLTSSRMRIESLFIDEGFGSLDADTLRTAMDALAHLEAQGRKVGVISHVAEMADAIPVQIRVVKGPGGASRILVPEERV